MGKHYTGFTRGGPELSPKAVARPRQTTSLHCPQWALCPLLHMRDLGGKEGFSDGPQIPGWGPTVLSGMTLLSLPPSS